ncbi:amino acid ABC transporter permease [Treponema zioleckii]|uniref:amino acid ABC transporter permease n=1 Tax=Treponema zioleckii TaxID=331680 RepID=UPI00168AE15B|nr:amino acid ABC transporter permease [Treponema zioleckii]
MTFAGITFSDYFSFDKLWKRIPVLLEFLPITLLLTLVAFVLSTLLGLIIAVIRVKKIKVLNTLTKIFLSIIRGTPLIIQLYVMRYGMSAILRAFNGGINVRIDGIWYAFVALGLYQAAFTSETIRAALESVDRGQIEAAQAMGMSYPQVLKRVIIPESLEIALPGLVNSLIGLFKGTSLASACGVIEITYKNTLISGNDYRYLEGYVALAIIYWIITFILEQFSKNIESRIKIPDNVESINTAKNNSRRKFA